MVVHHHGFGNRLCKCMYVEKQYAIPILSPRSRQSVSEKVTWPFPPTPHVLSPKQSGPRRKEMMIMSENREKQKTPELRLLSLCRRARLDQRGRMARAVLA